MAERVEGDDVGGGGGGGGSSAMDLTEGGACVAGVSTHDGHYMHYNIFGNFFEVSAKYVPPIRPIGRGAYGIVWCVFFFLLSPSSSPQLSFFKLFPFPFFFSTRLCPVFCRLQVSLPFYADFGRFDWGFFWLLSLTGTARLLDGGSQNSLPWSFCYLMCAQKELPLCF